MKRGIFAAISVVLALLVYAPVRADVNDFTITDFQMDMYLSRDADGRSTLTTKEMITADFPNVDQNHGLERAIPSTYDGHTTSLTIKRVEDLSASKSKYSTRESNGNTVLRIGDADTYVHGKHTYLIEYAQRDVTKYFDDSGIKGDEFYWDTNGVDWRVPIDSLTVRIHMDEQLRGLVRENARCYFGYAGENQSCELKKESDGFAVTATGLRPHQNVSVAFGFPAKTFAAYQPSLTERLMSIWGIVTTISTPLGIGALAWLLVHWWRAKGRAKEVGTIIPEYLPPKDVSVTAAANIVNAARTAMTAQIIDFAVRHYIKIYQTREKSLFKQAEYDLEITKPIDDLKWEEQELIRDLFDGTVDVGTRMSMKTLRSGTGFYNRVQNNDLGLNQRVTGEYALRARNPETSRWFKRFGVVMLVLAVVLLSPIFFVTSVTSFFLGWLIYPLTDKGLATLRYLLGLKEYISVAETERIRMLQSPEGAAKVGEPIDANDQSQLIKLYERVLPYAVLFGQEKEWNKRLGVLYESTGAAPAWYEGSRGAFNAAVFTTSMNNFSYTTTYASPSNSSSGGSGGGGFSGGGGGGGGGGGW